jgi:hypothetical protein
MAKLLFHLNAVDEEEANEVRVLLESASIPCYETHAGKWGISVAAIWVSNDEDFEQARRLLDEYQHERSQRLSEHSEPEPTIERWKRRPVDLVLVLVGLGIVLGLSLWPFLTAFQ